MRCRSEAGHSGVPGAQGSKVTSAMEGSRKDHTRHPGSNRDRNGKFELLMQDRDKTYSSLLYNIELHTKFIFECFAMLGRWGHH